MNKQSVNIRGSSSLDASPSRWRNARFLRSIGYIWCGGRRRGKRQEGLIFHPPNTYNTQQFPFLGADQDEENSLNRYSMNLIWLLSQACPILFFPRDKRYWYAILFLCLFLESLFSARNLIICVDVFLMSWTFFASDNNSYQTFGFPRYLRLSFDLMNFQEITAVHPPWHPSDQTEWS